MHIPDGFLSTEVTLALDAGAVLAVGGAVVALRRDAGTGGASSPLRERLAAVPAVGALLFAAQMLNVPVAGGTSGHLIGAVLACMLLGAPLGFLTTAAVLSVQAVAFADGGVLALGANVLVMGGIGALAAMATDRVALPRPLAAGLAASAALLAGAVAVGALLELSGTAPEAIGIMAETHVPIALIEGAITAIAVALTGMPVLTGRVRSGAGGALLLGLVALTPLASARPDGLERVAHDLGFAAQATAGTAFALAPDYVAPALSGAVAETIGAALLGVLLIALMLAGLTALARTVGAIDAGGSPGTAAPLDRAAST